MGQAVCQIGGVGVRQIKFRAWDKKRLEMRQSHNLLIDTLDGTISWQFGYDEPELLDQDNFVLMQFTGLLDKNGKEIYEGDIIVYATPPECDPKVVEWGTIPDPEISGELAVGFNINPGISYKIIGNIYQEP